MLSLRNFSIRTDKGNWMRRRRSVELVSTVSDRKVGSGSVAQRASFTTVLRLPLSVARRASFTTGFCVFLEPAVLTSVLGVAVGRQAVLSARQAGSVARVSFRCSLAVVPWALAGLWLLPLFSAQGSVRPGPVREGSAQFRSHSYELFVLLSSSCSPRCTLWCLSVPKYTQHPRQ